MSEYRKEYEEYMKNPCKELPKEERRDWIAEAERELDVLYSKNFKFNDGNSNKVLTNECGVMTNEFGQIIW